MNFDELIDAHTGREENIARQEANFARAAKHRRERRLEKRKTLIDTAAHVKAKALHEARVEREEPEFLGHRDACDRAHEIFDREGSRGQTLLLHGPLDHQWSDLDPARSAQAGARYIELPHIGPPAYFKEPGDLLEPLVSTRRYEIVDRHPNGTWVLNQVA